MACPFLWASWQMEERAKPNLNCRHGLIIHHLTHQLRSPPTLLAPPPARARPVDLCVMHCRPHSTTLPDADPNMPLPPWPIPLSVGRAPNGPIRPKSLSFLHREQHGVRQIALPL